MLLSEKTPTKTKKKKPRNIPVRFNRILLNVKKNVEEHKYLEILFQSQNRDRYIIHTGIP